MSNTLSQNNSQKISFMIISCIIFVIVSGFLVTQFKNKKEPAAVNINVSVSKSKFPLEKEPNLKAKNPNFVINEFDPFFEAKERAKFWKEKGYTFDATNTTPRQMDYMVRAIERAKYWSNYGFTFNPQTITDYEMDSMVSAYEKAHNIIIVQK